MTAKQLVYQALRHIGQIEGPGQTASNSENTDGLTALNKMLENWSTERLNIFTITRATHALGSSNVYTIGPSATDFDTTRPLKIESAETIVGGVTLPVKLISEKEWSAISAKGATSPVVLQLYCDYASPIASLYVWPTPSGTPSLVLGTWEVLSTFATIDTDVEFPAGYDQAIAYNLALRLASDYGVAPSSAVINIAASSLAAIRALNGSLPGADTGAAEPDALPKESN